MKILLIIFGIISFVLGAIGIILPILPTTPFLLLSAFCFQSSDRFHQYLIQTKLYQNISMKWLLKEKQHVKKKSILVYSNTCFFNCDTHYASKNWKNMFINCDEYSSFYHVKESGDYQ